MPLSAPNTPERSASHDGPLDGTAGAPDARWFTRHRWVPYVLPLVMYLLTDWALARYSYPLATAVQLVATLGAVWLVAPVYRAAPGRVTGLAVVVGIVGGVLWIATCRLGWEARLLTVIGRADWVAAVARPGFDPWTALGDTPWGLAAFLVVRFLGLVLVVPVAEEFFLRGFVMRFFVRVEWWTIPWGEVTWAMAAVGTLYGVLSHPAEWIAAALWFSLITLLYARTRSIWDCVVAHAITNGLLGTYIVLWQDWKLW